MQEVKSKVISHIGYDPHRREMTVRFHSGKDYVYEDVSPEQHSEFLTAPSIGKHFSEHIRKRKNRPA